MTQFTYCTAFSSSFPPYNLLKKKKEEKKKKTAAKAQPERDRKRRSHKLIKHELFDKSTVWY